VVQSGLSMHWRFEAVSDMFVGVGGIPRGLEVVGGRWASSDARKKVKPALKIIARVPWLD